MRWLLAMWLAVVPVLFGAAAARAEIFGYVLYGQGQGGRTVAMARTAIDGLNQPCPSLIPNGGSGPVPMTPRTNPNPNNFPVTVCEAPYPTGSSVRVAGTALTLPVVSAATPSRIAVVGDSGCKDNLQTQPCTPSAWPFAAIAGRVSQQAPDVVIHVGDYNYRGTPGTIPLTGRTDKVPVYDAGDNVSLDQPMGGPHYSQNMKASLRPDSWVAWRNDFFIPAAAALPAAPWIFVRGNHELCSRAGPGFLFFLDPGSALLGGGATQATCPDQDGPSPRLLTPTYRVTLGDMAFVVLDSANAADDRSWDQDVHDRLVRDAQALVPAGTPTWILTHRPFWGVFKDEAIGANVTLQLALRATPPGVFGRDVALVLSGHMHQFQSLGFGTAVRHSSLSARVGC